MEELDLKISFKGNLEILETVAKCRLTKFHSRKIWIRTIKLFGSGISFFVRILPMHGSGQVLNYLLHVLEYIISVSSPKRSNFLAVET